MSDDTSLTARLRDTLARLAPTQDGDVSPQARDERPITVGREEHTQEPDRDDIDRWVAAYYDSPLIRNPIRNFAADVVEPGYRVLVDAGDEDEPTVPSEYPMAEYRGMALSAALERWLSSCAIVGGRFDRDFSDLLEDVVIDLRGRRGTALVEHAYDDPRERDHLLGLRAFKAETTTAYTREGKRILLRPDDTEIDFETVAVQNIAGDPTRFDTAPTTPAENAAAFVQFDDILGDYNERDDIPFALDDVTIISNDPDTGTIYGEPDVASVIERSEELREMFSDTAQAIKAVGYGHWLARVDTDDEDEAKALLDSLDPTTPERIDVTNYQVELDQFDSDVPSNVDHIKQQIEYILAALPTPLYRVGFAGDINRDVTAVQQDDYREEVARERDRLESAFHDLLHQKAREFLTGDAKSDAELDVDVALRIRPAEAESPLEDEAVDADEFSSLMQGVKAAAPGGAVEQVIPPHELRERFLGLDADPPEAPDADAEALRPRPDEADPDVRAAFEDAYLRDYVRDDKGRFAETPGMDLPDIDFSGFGTNEDRQNVKETFNEWAAWPLSEDTTPAWDAAISGEEFDEDARFTSNLPEGPGLGSFLGDPQPEKQKSMAKHSEWLTEQIKDKHGGSVKAHRIIHGDAAETLRNGGSLEPRALASWTTDESKFDEIVAQTGADMDEDLSDSVVVTKEIPAESVFGIHTANRNLDARNQNELIAALDRGDSLSDGEIREASEVLDDV